jgi:predicted TPR repeat methyltransferase
LRGSVLKELGRFDEAAASFEQALARGGDPELLRYYLAALARRDAPPTAPAGYVQALFDGYAPAFDAQLVALLKYQAPQLLAQGLAKLDRRFSRALDLGCGTGLCGPLVKPFTDRLEGVDLSDGMLRSARALGVYDSLEQAEIAAFLRSAQPPYDLVLAADVFVYVGALEPVFADVARCMPAGGVFCFSVEEAREGGPPVLQPSLRYAHSESYVRELAARHGFEVATSLRAPIREEQQVPVPGLYFWLVRSA